MAAHPLQIGLSMKAEVSVRQDNGARLPELAHTAPAYSTDVFQSPDAMADSRVRAIIAENESAALAKPSDKVATTKSRVGDAAGARSGEATDPDLLAQVRRQRGH